MKSLKLKVALCAIVLSAATASAAQERPAAGGLRYEKEHSEVPRYRAPNYSDPDVGLEVEHLRKRIDALEIRNAQTEQRLAEVVTSYNELVQALNARQQKLLQQAPHAIVGQPPATVSPSGVPLPRQ